MAWLLAPGTGHARPAPHGVITIRWHAEHELLAPCAYCQDLLWAGMHGACGARGWAYMDRAQWMTGCLVGEQVDSAVDGGGEPARRPHEQVLLPVRAAST